MIHQTKASGEHARRSLFLSLFLVLLLVCAGASLIGTVAKAQTTRGATATADHPANLRQVMRGILYPSSNVVFAAQQDLDRFEPPRDPSVSPNLLTSTYGGWEAVENASLALSEAASLLVVPGRMCANGTPVPVQAADWMGFVQGLREAGVASYEAAQTQSTDEMLEAAGTVSEACYSCHEVYRDDGGEADRCLP